MFRFFLLFLIAGPPPTALPFFMTGTGTRSTRDGTPCSMPYAYAPEQPHSKKSIHARSSIRSWPAFEAAFRLRDDVVISAISAPKRRGSARISPMSR